MEEFRSRIMDLHSVTCDELGGWDDEKWVPYGGVNALIRASANNLVLNLSERFESYITWCLGDEIDDDALKFEIENYKWSFGLSDTTFPNYLESNKFDCTGEGA